MTPSLKTVICPLNWYLIMMTSLGALTLSNPSQAQDTLYRADGSKEIVTILEVNETQLKFLKHANPGGPTYVISKNDVVKIAYQSGIIETVSHQSSPAPKDPISRDFRRNFISINITDLFFNLVTLGYERIAKSGAFSVKVPLSFGVGDQQHDRMNVYYSSNKIFSVGADFYFYNSGQGRARFFYGPSLEYGQFRYPTFSYNYNANSYNSGSAQATYFAFLCSAGVIFQPDRHFNISMNAGLGYSHRQVGLYSFYPESGLTIRGGVLMGYKF